MEDIAGISVSESHRSPLGAQMKGGGGVVCVCARVRCVCACVCVHCNFIEVDDEPGPKYPEHF